MIKIEALEKHLTQVKVGSESPKCLYVISTDEPLLLMETQDKLRAALLAQGFAERDAMMVEKTFNWSSLVSANQNMSLFGDKKLIELTIPTGKPGREGGDMLRSYAAQISLADQTNLDTVTCIYMPRLDTVGYKSAWFTALDQAGSAVRIESLDRTVLPLWLKQRLKVQGLEVEPGEAGERSLEFLVSQVEGNLIAAHQEIQKLGLMFPKGVVSEEQFRDAILNVARYNVFQLSETFLEGDMNRINRMLDGLKGEGEALVLVVWSLSEEIRLLMSLRQEVDAGGNLMGAMKAKRIWGKKEQLFPGAVRRMNMATIQRATKMIADIDKQSKGIAAPEMPKDPWDGLRRIGGLFSYQ